MEFMNVGGGELLIIILLALVLFSPEDILKLMRTIGKYARTARQMWSNVSTSLQEDYIPDEVKDVVKETASTVKEARATLTNVREQFNDISTSVQDEVSDATQLADSELSDAVNVVNEVPAPDVSDESSLDDETETTDQSDDTLIDSDIQSVENSILPPEAMISSDAVEMEQPQKDAVQVQTADEASGKVLDPTDTDEQDALQALDIMDDSTTLIKEDTKKTQDLKSSVNAPSVNAKLAKVTEDSLKEDANGS